MKAEKNSQNRRESISRKKMPLFEVHEALRVQLLKAADSPACGPRREQYQRALDRWAKNAKRSFPRKQEFVSKSVMRSGEISLDVVLALARDSDVKAHRLLKGAQIIVSRPQKKFVQSPETRKKFAQWRLELEDRKYRKMVESVSSRDTGLRDRREIKVGMEMDAIALLFRHALVLKKKLP